MLMRMLCSQDGCLTIKVNSGLSSWEGKWTKSGDLACFHKDV